MLQKFKYNEITPTGWIKDQLEVQYKGLSGNLDKVWPDIRDSKWINGSKDSWERFPYWLDGYIPLVYLLNKEEDINKVEKYIDIIIENQRENGWICPVEDKDIPNYDLWAVILISKVLIEHYLYTGSEKSYQACLKVLKNLYDIFKSGRQLENWGKFRWFEAFIALNAIKERENLTWINELAEMLYEQGEKYLDFLPLYKKSKREWRYDTHGVNIAMAIKSIEEYKYFKDEPIKKDAQKLFNYIMKYNDAGNGIYTADECLANKSPIRGTELCAVVELMYSFERLFMITKNPLWLNLLEKASFNALPATISYDMWAHQYDQQFNQVECKKTCRTPIFGTNGDESNLFGLEPHFGCCTSNFSQGFPKLASFIFLHNGNNIYITSPISSKLNTTIDGKKVEVEVISEYPFRNNVKVIINKEARIKLNVFINIQKDAKNITLNSKNLAVPGLIKLNASKLHNENKINFDFETHFVTYSKTMYYIQKGSLVFTLGLQEKYRRKEYIRDNVERKFPYCDYELRTKDKYNYAFLEDQNFEEIHQNLCSSPFIFNSPIKIKVNLEEIQWRKEKGFKDFPKAIITKVIPFNNRITKEFIPYGCSKLRMTAMPKIK